jgi:uncharacterized protein (TIGR00369 family)
MSREQVPPVEALQQLLSPLLPGLLGIELLEATPDRVVGQLRVRPAVATTGGILHGGAVMALADSLGGIGTYLNLPAGHTTATIESSTKFLGAAPVASLVIGEATPLHKGRTTQVWQTAIRREDGRLCAMVIQTQLVMAPKPAG